MKNVILINPKFSSLPETGVPGGLISVAAHTANFHPEVSVRIIDENIEKIDYSEMKNSLVGITTNTPSARRVKEIIGKAKEGDAYGVVVGGIHPTILPDEMTSHASVVRGEIEGGSWHQVLADYLSMKPLRSIYESDRVNLKNIPLAPKHIYSYCNKLLLQQISGSRGCPLGCDYCTVHLVAGSKIRHRSSDSILEEMKVRSLLDGYFNRVAFLTNDSFGKQAKDLEFLNQLKERLNGNEITWMAQVGMEALANEEFLSLVNSIGTSILAVGVESPFQKELSSVKKVNREMNAREIFERVKRYPNIHVMQLLMVGFDFEPADRFEQILEFIRQTRPESVYVSIVTPLPGSKIARALDGRILPEYRGRWEYYDTRHLVFEPRYQSENTFKSMSVSQFLDGYHWLTREAESLIKTWNQYFILPVR